VKLHSLILIFWAALAGVAGAADQQPHEEGIEAKDYVWNQMYAEKLQALKAKGEPARGEIAFEVCQGCHRAGAVGRVNGTYPRLAGQHATVLIKQMTDVRAGRRDNPKMYPFADKHVLEPEEIADVATYLEKLPSPPTNGRGDGEQLASGKKLYDRDCAECHGKTGMGDSAKFYPRVAGQHYAYLLRESRAIRNTERRNAYPEMVKVIKPYSDADLAAVADYMSRFETR